MWSIRRRKIKEEEKKKIHTHEQALHCIQK
jgi:hypothetical protein